jgi:hypothetical protein
MGRRDHRSSGTPPAASSQCEPGHDVRLVTVATAFGRAVILVLALSVVPSCGTSGTSTRTTSQSLVRAPTGSIYLAREPDAWNLNEARDPRPGGPLAQVEPSLDWYAEYERFPDPSHSLRVRLSGHGVAGPRLQQELRGFNFERAREASWPAVRGRSSDPTGPEVILLAVAEDYTVMALSYELDADQMTQWSRSLQPVDESEWVARGGVVER